MAKHTMGWSIYLNTLLVDEETFRAEFEQIAAYVRSQAAPPRPPAAVRITRTRANVVTLVATSQGALGADRGAHGPVADARRPAAPAEAREMLERVLADYDAGLARADHGGVPCTS